MRVKFEAIQFTDYDSYLRIVRWMKELNDTFALADEIVFSTGHLTIQTAKGKQIARMGDYVMRDSEGAFFVCAPYYR